jgi:osmotically-inducible protein OsmY
MSHLVDVETKDGIVTLSGSVDNLLAKDRAVELARTVKGVRSVVDQLTVKPVARTDEEIYKDVMDALLENPATDAHEIKASVTDGVVTLTGAVDSWQEKQLCAQVVKGVKGIKDIENEVEVEYEGKRPDGEIEADIENRLAWDVWVDDALVTVTVKNGRVTLTGVVKSLDAREAAGQLARNTVGVWRVKNHLRVRPPDIGYRTPAMPRGYDTEISEKVRAGLFRDPYVAQHEIRVMISNHRVVLSGRVDSQFKKNRAEDIASRVKRVVAVRNNIVVDRSWTEKSDWEIMEDVKGELWWSPYIDSDEVAVTVQDGIVTLVGVVDSLRDRRIATENAYEGGGKRVRNHLRVRYGPPHLRP